MRLILLSGGSGTRLWPLSNSSRSKQFLKVLEDENCERVSMVQRVWTQLQATGLSEAAIIATSHTQKDVLRNQLGEVPVVVEPERRDTFPAISLATAYLHSVQKVDPDEVVVVCPVDPYVDTDFFRHLSSLTRSISENEAEIALVGAQPTYPSSKYGYIIPKGIPGKSQYVEVEYFKEKPSEKEAEGLIKQNAFWNCGVFAFKLKYILEILEERGFATDYEKLLNEYPLLPMISFDYEVVEKANRIITYPYAGYWKDLGTWNTLTEEMSTPILGEGIICKQSSNVHIVNELDIPVVVVGMKNTVVASSPDGILVTDKVLSPKIKEIMKDINRQPMFAERQWGWFKILDMMKNMDFEVITKKVFIRKGTHFQYHYHENMDEVWTILKGIGYLILDGAILDVKQGDSIQIPRGTKHSFHALEELEYIEVQRGKAINPDDVIVVSLSVDYISELTASGRQV